MTTTTFHADLLALAEHPVRHRRLKRKRFAPRTLKSGPAECRVWDADTSQIIVSEFTDEAVEVMNTHRAYLAGVAADFQAEHGGPLPEVQEAFLTEIVKAELDAGDAGKPRPWGTPRAEQRTAPVAAPAGRNDPCPCGSGKKYKRCHG